MGKKQHISRKLWRVPILAVLMILKFVPLIFEEISKVWQRPDDVLTENHDDNVRALGQSQPQTEQDDHDKHHEEEPETEEEAERSPGPIDGFSMVADGTGIFERRPYQVFAAGTSRVV